MGGCECFSIYSEVATASLALFAITVEAGALAKELLAYEITVNQHANAQINARSGAHDDLVSSLGLSCGIDRTGSRVESRNYLAPGGETIEDALRDRWARRRKKGP